MGGWVRGRKDDEETGGCGDWEVGRLREEEMARLGLMKSILIVDLQ
jgi:hypothetical protein